MTQRWNTLGRPSEEHGSRADLSANSLCYFSRLPPVLPYRSFGLVSENVFYSKTFSACPFTPAILTMLIFSTLVETFKTYLPIYFPVSFCSMNRIILNTDRKLKSKKEERARNVSRLVECWLSSCKVLALLPSTAGTQW